MSTPKRLNLQALVEVAYSRQTVQDSEDDGSSLIGGIDEEAAIDCLQTVRH